MSEENKGSQPLTAGSTAPDFTLQARSGKTISLHTFAGQKDVLIYFYPKDDTPGCTRESCSLRDGWGDLGKAGIEVLGISRDDAASHNAFAAKYNLPFELLTDADHSVHEKYGAWGQNPNPAWGVGPLRKSFLIGKDGKVKHVFDKVDTEHHAEQVLRAAGFAPAPKPATAPVAAPAAAIAPKPAAPPAPPAPRPAAPAMPAAAAPVPRPAAPPAPKPPAPQPPAPQPPAPKPPAPKAAAPAKKKAAPKKKAAKKATKKKAAKKAKTTPKKKAARKATKKAAKKRAAPKKKAARKPARKAAKKTKRAKKAAPKRRAKKAAKRKKR